MLHAKGRDICVGCARAWQDEMSQLLDRCTEEGVEYGFVFCYDAQFDHCNRGTAIRGSTHRVPLTGCDRVLGVLMGSFHTHPHAAAAASYGDVEAHIVGGLSFMIIGSANDPTGKRFRGFVINYDSPHSRVVIANQMALKNAISQGEVCLRRFYQENLEKTRSLWGDKEAMAFIEKFASDDAERTWMYTSYEWAILAGIAANVMETYPESVEEHPDWERLIMDLKSAAGDMYFHVNKHYTDMFEEINL